MACTAGLVGVQDMAVVVPGVVFRGVMALLLLACLAAALDGGPMPGVCRRDAQGCVGQECLGCVFAGSDHHLPGISSRGRIQGQGGGSASMHQGTGDSFFDQDPGSKVQGGAFGDAP